MGVNPRGGRGCLTGASFHGTVAVGRVVSKITRSLLHRIVNEINTC